MHNFIKRFEILIVALLLIWGTLFLLKMAYLPIYTSSFICIVYMVCVYLYLHYRYEMKPPFILFVLVYATVALDGLGNFFNLYNTKFQYIQYDEFTHTAVPALTAPVGVWLLQEVFKRFGLRIPLGLTTFFAVAILFTLNGFYEIVELWDDKYMHPEPGMRIHGSYDTANDLQFDLLGLILGGLIAFFILRRREQK